MVLRVVFGVAWYKERHDWFGTDTILDTRTASFHLVASLFVFRYIVTPVGNERINFLCDGTVLVWYVPDGMTFG